MFYHLFAEWRNLDAAELRLIEKTNARDNEEKM